MNANRPHRRGFLGFAGLTATLPFLSGCGVAGDTARKERAYRVTKSKAQWRRELTSAEYRVLREAGTERAHSSPLDKEKRKGVFACAGCGNRVYSSAHKYDSGTGWPSFWKPIDAGAVGTSTDYKIGLPRTEVHCADCGGHLGHIFSDGPKPTGKRHCLNGVALDFNPA